MDLSLDTLTLPPWDAGMAEEWDEAYEKVENYLRACRVASRLHRARLSTVILQRAYARRQQAGGDGQSLGTLAIQEARALINQWLLELLPEQPGETGHNPVDLWVALYLSDGPVRWPNAFLNSPQTPKEFVESLRLRSVQAGPELQISRMVPRPLDLGLLPELAGNVMESFRKWPVLRILLSWLLFILLLVALFWYTHVM